MKYLVVALALLISGCATTQVPGSVQIPVAVKCTTPDPLQPTYRFNPPYEKLFDAVRDILGDREAALAYEIELRAALKSCK